ncbi:hypothetical protein Hanom_Chr04g00293331 [Helianthus anomalus]
MINSITLSSLRVHGVPSATPCGDPFNRAVRHRHHCGDQERGGVPGGGSPKREGGEREALSNQCFFLFNKKPIHLRGECRHQFRVLGEFKRGVDVAHED